MLFERSVSASYTHVLSECRFSILILYQLRKQGINVDIAILTQTLSQNGLLKDWQSSPLLIGVIYANSRKVLVATLCKIVALPITKSVLRFLQMNLHNFLQFQVIP